MQPNEWIEAMNQAITYCQNNKDNLTAITPDAAEFKRDGLMSHEQVKQRNKKAAVFINFKV